MRVRFYLCDFDEDLWVDMPCKVNRGDTFYIDDFISKEDEDRLKDDIIDYLYNDGSILKCGDYIFGKGKDGIYQQCYLVEIEDDSFDEKK